MSFEGKIKTHLWNKAFDEGAEVAREKAKKEEMERRKYYVHVGYVIAIACIALFAVFGKFLF